MTRSLTEGEFMDEREIKFMDHGPGISLQPNLRGNHRGGLPVHLQDVAKCWLRLISTQSGLQLELLLEVEVEAVIRG